MKIPAVTAKTLINQMESRSHPAERGFSSILNEMSGARAIPPLDAVIMDLSNNVGHLISGRNISTQDLLKCQIQAGQLQLHVELVSRAADAAVSSIKRLQSPQ